ncbi:MAG: protein kinase, partial [Candidatus Obscuribacterales bacterium]|nr:protein kinase [Candidatus Obscuribacterales bacterium]
MLESATAKTAVVNYKSPTAQRSRRTAVLAVACFLVLFPLPILSHFFVNMKMDMVLALFLSLSIFSLVFLLVAIHHYRHNRQLRIILTEKGIVLPGRRLPEHFSESGVPWSMIENIAYLKGDAGRFQDGTVVISVRRSNSIELKLENLTGEDADKLVSACDLWANQPSKDETFQQLVEAVTQGRLAGEDGGFTALWMEEAQRRLSATPFVPLSPGTTLQDGRVKVVQPLTAGGWSAIYLCQWQSKTTAVLKEAVVPPGANDGLKEKARQHFEREAILLSGLDNPKIAKVLDYFIENGRQYMVLERISGANLRSYIKDR